MKIYRLVLRHLITVVALSLCLMLSLGLAACGTEATPVSSMATGVAGAVQTAGTAAANGANTAGTVVSGAVGTAATALTQAPGVIAGAAGTAGSALTSGAKTAGTAIAGVLTPGATPTIGAALTPGTTTATGTGTGVGTPIATDLPVYPGSLSVNIIPDQYSNIIKDWPVVNTIMSNSALKLYTVGGVAKQENVVEFYQTALSGAGWTNRTDQLGAVTNSGKFNILGTVPSIYTRGNEILLMGVSGPLSEDYLKQGTLGASVQAGDIVIVTILGKSTTTIS